MKRVSEATKDRAMVLGIVPAVAIGVLGMCCMAVHVTTGFVADWVVLGLMFAMSVWASIGFCVFVVVNWWPQEK